MSEKSLDDFFAKKDKAKKSKKTKAKFTTSHEIAKKLTSGPTEEVRKLQKKSEKDKKTDEKGEIINSQNVDGDAIPAEEWKEEETKEVDYSDLKIQALQVGEEPVKVEGDDDEEEEFDEFGELIKSKSQVPAGPWNVGTPAEGEPTENPEEPSPTTQPEPVVQEDHANVQKGVYVPPSRRNVPASSSNATQSTNQRARMRGKKKAPEIDCQQEFPSLAASADILKYSDKRDEKTFETVTKGVPKSGGQTARGPNLQLDNRYSALDHRN